MHPILKEPLFFHHRFLVFSKIFRHFGKVTVFVCSFCRTQNLFYYTIVLQILPPYPICRSCFPVLLLRLSYDLFCSASYPASPTVLFSDILLSNLFFSDIQRSIDSILYLTAQFILFYSISSPSAFQGIRRPFLPAFAPALPWNASPPDSIK